MRWMSFEKDGTSSFGLVVGDGVVDAGARGQYASLKEAIRADGLAELAAGLGDTPDHGLDEVRFLPVIPDPDKILCIGLNYRAHQEETGRGGEGQPTVFVRFAAAQVGHDSPMVRPARIGAARLRG